MALFKRQDSIYWWIRFTAPNGREIRRSAGTTDKRQAQEYEDSLKAKLWRVENLGEKPRRTWQEAVLRFVGEQEGQPSLPVQKLHLRSLDKWLRGRYLDEIGRDILDTVAQARKAEGVSPATVNRMLEVVRSLLRRAVREWEWLDKAPYVRMLPVQKKRIRWLTREESRSLLSVLPEHLADMAEFTLAAGPRERNVTHLEWPQVDMVRRVAWIHADQSKTKKAYSIPLNSDAMAVIRRQIGKHETRVFTYRGNPVDRCNNHGWRTALKKAGIKDFRWHDLRHTWASWHVQSGTSLQALMEFGGWSTIEMVMCYAHLSAGQLAHYAENIVDIRTFSGTGRKSSGTDVA